MKGCGRILGHGEVCHEGYLCDKCENYPTKEEIETALKIISELAMAAAIHNCFTTPSPELIKVIAWLNAQKG